MVAESQLSFLHFALNLQQLVFSLLSESDEEQYSTLCLHSSTSGA